MARNMRGRIRRLERLQPSATEEELHTLRLMAQLTRRLWKHAPGLELVERCDTDAETWRSIQEDRALMRGDWDEAVRLGAAKRPRDRVKPETPRARMEEAAGLGELVMAEGHHLDAAIEAARLRPSMRASSGITPA